MVNVHTFTNGVQVVNTTPHSLTFLDGDDVISVPKSGVLINAKIKNKETKEGVLTFKVPDFVPDPESEVLLQTLESEVPVGTLVIGSIIAAQAYPGRVVGMISAPGFERVPPAEKRMSITEFTRYPPKE